MNKKVRLFLETDLLERYTLEDTNAEENLKVERYIALYPEVGTAYNELQKNLELFAKAYTQKAPTHLKERILNRIGEEKSKGNTFNRWVIAASFLAIFSMLATYFFYKQNKTLQERNELVSNQIKNLEIDLKVQLEDLRNQYIVLNNPNTRKINVIGNKKAKALKAVAYVNPVKKLSYINVSHLPQLPEEQCFQMWSEVNGELVNLGAIKDYNNPDQMLPLPYADNAVSYITIEPNCGNDKPSVHNIVANLKY